MRAARTASAAPASGFTTHITKAVEPVELVTVVSALAGRIRYASGTDEETGGTPPGAELRPPRP